MRMNELNEKDAEILSHAIISVFKIIDTTINSFSIKNDLTICGSIIGNILYHIFENDFTSMDNFLLEIKRTLHEREKEKIEKI